MLKCPSKGYTVVLRIQPSLTHRQNFTACLAWKFCLELAKTADFLFQVVCEILADSADGSSSIPVHQFSHIFSFLANRYELSLHTFSPLSVAQTLVAYLWYKRKQEFSLLSCKLACGHFFERKKHWEVKWPNANKSNFHLSSVDQLWSSN